MLELLGRTTLELDASTLELETSALELDAQFLSVSQESSDLGPALSSQDVNQRVPQAASKIRSALQTVQFLLVIKVSFPTKVSNFEDGYALYSQKMYSNGAQKSLLVF
jgi:hypothetical protein